MKLVFSGPQASGKGTQAKKAAEKLGIPHISMGDLLREEIKAGTDIGQRVKNAVDNGLLVPREITFELLRKRTSREDAKKGFILDGFPRDLGQAEFVVNEIKIDKVVSIDLDDDVAVKRISGRRTCEKCGQIYHIESKPPQQDGVCDIDQGILIQRDDDVPDKVKVRLEIYHDETEPLLQYYAEKNVEVIHVNGDRPIDDVFAEVCQKLGI